MKKYPIGEISELRVLGRTTKERNPLTLFWTASGFEVGFRGTELWCEFESDYETYEQWIAVYVNGCFLSRQMLAKGKSNVCLVRNMQTLKENRITVLKEVQAMPGDEAVYLSVHSLSTDGEFVATEPAGLKIEFIGDSITSGEGSYGASVEGDWIAQWFSTSQAYTHRVAQELQAEYRVVSQSGYGLFSAWDNNREHVIPPAYEMVCGVLGGERNVRLGAQSAYDFSEWQPDVIIVNLGTNDAEGFNQPAWTDEKTGIAYRMERDEAGQPKEECLKLVQDTAESFLAKLRKNNPGAEIFWCFGLMGTLTAPAIQKGMEKYCAESGDTKVHYVPLTEISGDEIGARWHPSANGHARAAAEIVTAVRSVFQA